MNISNTMEVIDLKLSVCNPNVDFGPSEQEREHTRFTDFGPSVHFMGNFWCIFLHEFLHFIK